MLYVFLEQESPESLLSLGLLLKRYPGMLLRQQPRPIANNTHLLRPGWSSSFACLLAPWGLMVCTAGCSSVWWVWECPAAICFCRVEEAQLSGPFVRVFLMRPCFHGCMSSYDRLPKGQSCILPLLLLHGPAVPLYRQSRSCSCKAD